MWGVGERLRLGLLSSRRLVVRRRGHAFVDGLPINVDAETDKRSLREVLALSRSAGLTTYDAAYLELALRHGWPWRLKTERLFEPLVV